LILTITGFGGNFTVKQLKRNYANFYSLEAPANITDQFNNNDIVHNEVVDFFKMLTLTASEMSATEIIEAILRTLDGTFYMRRSDDYYQMKLHFPYFRLKWENKDL
jgi:hypothetical protein